MTEATFTFVAVDADNEPRPVDGVMERRDRSRYRLLARGGTGRERSGIACASMLAALELRRSSPTPRPLEGDGRPQRRRRGRLARVLAIAISFAERPLWLAQFVAALLTDAVRRPSLIWHALTVSPFVASCQTASLAPPWLPASSAAYSSCWSAGTRLSGAFQWLSNTTSSFSDRAPAAMSRRSARRSWG